MPTAAWNKEDRIDWLIFRAQLETVVFFNRVIDSEQTDPQIYVNECSNGIFSLLKKEYDTPRNRALSATARLKQMPALIEQGKQNLIKPVRLYAQLLSNPRDIDSLFTDADDVLIFYRPLRKIAGMPERALTSLHGLPMFVIRLPEWAVQPGLRNLNYLLNNLSLASYARHVECC